MIVLPGQRYEKAWPQMNPCLLIHIQIISAENNNDNHCLAGSWWCKLKLKLLLAKALAIVGSNFTSRNMGHVDDKEDLQRRPYMTNMGHVDKREDLQRRPLMTNLTSCRSLWTWFSGLRCPCFYSHLFVYLFLLACCDVCAWIFDYSQKLPCMQHQFFWFESVLDFTLSLHATFVTFLNFPQLTHRNCFPLAHQLDSNTSMAVSLHNIIRKEHPLSPHIAIMQKNCSKFG